LSFSVSALLLFFIFLSLVVLPFMVDKRLYYHRHWNVSK